MMKFLRAVVLACAFLMFLPGSPAISGQIPPTPAPEELQVVFIRPFQAVMMPPALEERIFDLFVDRLNEQGRALGFRFVILKETDDPEWLRRQIWIEGELFGYLEESGCCSTEMRLKSRAQLHRPGVPTPVVIDDPRELFFSHDETSIEAQRQNLAEKTAETLARRLLTVLSPS